MQFANLYEFEHVWIEMAEALYEVKGKERRGGAFCEVKGKASNKCTLA